MIALLHSAAEREALASASGPMFSGSYCEPSGVLAFVLSC